MTELAVSSVGHPWWSESKKLELIQAFVAMGNLRLAASTCNIPEVTARRWKAQAWWKEAEAELRKGGKLTLSGKLSDLVTKVFTALEDRIENGDWVHNPKTGKLERKPLSGAVINNIMKDTINQSVSLEKAGVEETVSQEGIESRLDKLREEILQAAGRLKKPQGEIIDVQAINPSNQGLGEAPGSEAGVQSGFQVSNV
jgi:hypothetical protein